MSFSSHDAFSQFKIDVERSSRYFHSTQTKQFLQDLLKSLDNKKVTMPKGTILYRAQVGYQTSLEHGFEPYPKDRMLPQKSVPSEGRLNSKGIPCLYTASDKTTAISEVRPRVSDYVSVASLRTNKDLHLIDCYKHLNDKSIQFRTIVDGNFKPNDNEIENEVWHQINRAFSRPISNRSEFTNYVSTQILSELVKTQGYDGVGFKSSLADGFNVALFDVNSATITTCVLHEVSKVSVNSSQICNTQYYV